MQAGANSSEDHQQRLRRGDREQCCREPKQDASQPDHLALQTHVFIGGLSCLASQRREESRKCVGSVRLPLPFWVYVARSFDCLKVPSEFRFIHDGSSPNQTEDQLNAGKLKEL